MQLSQSIAFAIEQELHSKVVAAYLESKDRKYQDLLDKRGENADSVLLTFVAHYIEQVGQTLTALHEFSLDTDSAKLIQPLLSICHDLFFDEQIQEDANELYDLLDQAYLVYRLIEEVNERFMFNYGVPLTPVNMTLSNIIVHEMLGQAFAVQLDQVASYSADTYFFSSDLPNQAKLQTFLRLRRTSQWPDIVKRWPCLAGDDSIHGLCQTQNLLIGLN